MRHRKIALVVVISVLALASGGWLLQREAEPASSVYQEASLFDAVLTIWMLASSVVYPVGIVGGRLGQIMSWNPMAVIIDAYRALVFGGTLPPAAPLAAIGAGSLLLLVVTWVMCINGALRAPIDKRFRGIKARALVALLIYLAEARGAVARDVIATLLWPESPRETARAR